MGREPIRCFCSAMWRPHISAPPLGAWQHKDRSQPHTEEAPVNSVSMNLFRRGLDCGCDIRLTYSKFS